MIENSSTDLSQDFTITEAAAARISDLLTKEASNAKLRVAVLGGGCSGFQYKFDFDQNLNQDDKIFSYFGVNVLVDDVSIPLLKGSVLDYVATLGSASFVIKNPNATAKCGCGNSFSI